VLIESMLQPRVAAISYSAFSRSARRRVMCALAGLQDSAQILRRKLIDPSNVAVHPRKWVEGKLDPTQ
jgi:hypothetical protein